MEIDFDKTSIYIESKNEMGIILLALNELIVSCEKKGCFSNDFKESILKLEKETLNCALYMSHKKN